MTFTASARKVCLLSVPLTANSLPGTKRSLKKAGQRSTSSAVKLARCFHSGMSCAAGQLAKAVLWLLSQGHIS